MDISYFLLVLANIRCFTFAALPCRSRRQCVSFLLSIAFDLDHIYIDIGLEGGSQGGNIIVTGTPEEVAKEKKSHTAHFLAKELSLQQP